MADNQDPLAALQQLLEEQKKQGASVSTDDVAPAETNPGLSAEEISSLQEEKKAEDQIEIAKQLAMMKNELQNTPQYKARMSQNASKEALAKQKELKERSTMIFQLKHLHD